MHSTALMVYNNLIVIPASFPILYLNEVAALPILSPDERAAIAGSPNSFYKHTLAKAVEIRQAVATKPLAQQIKIAAWNTWSCKHINESANLLMDLGADVLLLSEMDYGLARSGQHHTTADLAKKLGYGYVYGVELLDNGNKENKVGYSGNAILSRAELKRPALVRFALSDHNHTKRKWPGSRLAVLATIELAGQEVVFASVHFENRITPEQRGHVMESLLNRIEEYAPQLPAVVAGDMNTLTFAVDMKTFHNLDWVRQLMKEDPDRISNPIPHEPLFKIAQKYGYNWQDCNIISKPTQRYFFGPLSLRGGRNMDWFLIRGLVSSAPSVIDATPPDIAFPLSDHEVICVNTELTKD